MQAMIQDFKMLMVVALFYLLIKDFFITIKVNKMSNKLDAAFAEVERIKTANAKIAADIRRVVEKLENQVTDEQLDTLLSELRGIADAAEATDAIVPEDDEILG